MHGIEVTRESTESGLGTSRAAEVRIRRISVCHEDGGVMTFIPEAGEEFFSKDDVDRLVGILHQSSEAMEWGQISEGAPDAEQGRGLA
jgi:hypothetical protein